MINRVIEPIAPILAFRSWEMAFEVFTVRAGRNMMES